MHEASLHAVGIAAKAFEGAVMHRIHEEISHSTVAKAVLGIFMDQHKELTSPFPLVGEIRHAFEVVEHKAHEMGATLSNLASQTNSGPQNGR